MHPALKALDRIGSVGALLAAVAAPCCFPLFAAVSAAAGLGVLGRYEGAILNVFQLFAVLSVVGLALSYRRNHKPGPLLLGIVSVILLACVFHVSFTFVALYAGLSGLLAASAWSYWQTHNEPELQSVVTCPQCGHRAEETMPTSACLFFYVCNQCSAMLKPKAGDCCVFCSYGSVPCPPIQAGGDCCA